MEILGGLLVAFGALVLLAGVGLAALLALASMVVLHFLTQMSFKRVFFVSAGIGLLAPLFLGLAISGAVADGSIERELRAELGDRIQLPQNGGQNWREVLEDLQELSRENDNGTLTEEEAERRVEEILGGLEDMQIAIDVNGDGVVIGESDSGVPLVLPEGVEVPDASN